jgi:hypothetical protein
VAKTSPRINPALHPAPEALPALTAHAGGQKSLPVAEGEEESKTAKKKAIRTLQRHRSSL